MNVSNFIKNNSPTILSVMASFGVVATAVASGVATEKAFEKLRKVEKETDEPLTKLDIIKTVAPSYIPTTLIAGSTIFCILGANCLNKQKQATLTSAYALATQSFKEYREKLIEFHGKEIDEEVRNEVLRVRHDFHILDIDTPDRKLTFYEPYSNQYFERYEREVIDAEYHFNRNYVLGGWASVRDFLIMLGLDSSEEDEKHGWNPGQGYMWIDFEHYPVKDKHGNTYYTINYVTPPDIDWDEY